MHQQSLNSITSKDLQNLKKTRVFVAGDIILDVYINGKISRISPEAPAPVLLETEKKYVPGGAGNVAANMANIGANVLICARVGHDSEARILKSCLKKFGAKTALLFENSIPTTTKTRILSYHEFATSAQQLVRMDRESVSPIQKMTEQKCVEEFKKFILKGNSNALILSDYGKGFLTPSLIKKLIQIANKHKIPIIVDPKSTDVSRYANATVIKPNLSEGRLLFNYENLDESHSESFLKKITKIAENYLKKSHCQNIVMSLSQHGVFALGSSVQASTEQKHLHFTTKALQVADVSGAGDTLIAFLAMGLAAQFSFSQAIQLANIAAGIVCGKMGTSVVEMDELFEKFHTSVPRQETEKITNIKNILPIIQDLQNKNKKVVFTNGCFDILHAGHVEYLQKAKLLGDILVLGLNSDSSVKNLKGDSRPVQTAEDRAKILAALSCVDFIIEFDEQTPLNLIRELKPDILVKGADYDFDSTVGANDVISWGGKVVHIELLPGRSTSSILKKL